MRKFFSSLKFPFFILAVTLAGLFVLQPWSNEYVMRQEASANGYAIIADQYPTLSEEGKQLIRSRYSKGHLTKRDVSDIILSVVHERPNGIQTSPAPSFGDEPEDMSMLKVLFYPEPGSVRYKSKDELSRLVKQDKATGAGAGAAQNQVL